MEYNEILDILITELTEHALKECRKEDIDVNLKRNELVVLSEKIQGYIFKFDVQAKHDFENYINLMNVIAESKQKYLYIQGAKDCAHLLKSLEII